MEALRIIHFQERAAAEVAKDLRHFRQVIKNPRVPAQTAWPALQITRHLTALGRAFEPRRFRGVPSAVPSSQNEGARRRARSRPEYAKKKRLDVAARQLQTTDAPVKAIAVDAGYRHVSNFTRSFLKQFRVSPIEFRRIWRGRDIAA